MLWNKLLIFCLIFLLNINIAFCVNYLFLCYFVNYQQLFERIGYWQCIIMSFQLYVRELSQLIRWLAVA